MIGKLFQFVISRGSLPVLLTLLSATIVALVQGQLAASLVVLVLFVAGFQSLTLVYRSLFDRLVPIEQLDNTNRLHRVSAFKIVSLSLSALPLLALVSEILCWLVVAAIFLLFSYDFARLGKRAVNREAIPSGALETVKSSGAKVAVYVSGLAEVAYQINQWLPVLEKLGVPSIILVRQRGIYEGMPKTEIPIIYARNMAHVEQVLDSGIETVLYPANTMHNVQALRHFRLNHFFINHGESDKAVNQSKLLQAYDKLLVAGPLAHRRMLAAGLKLREGQVEYVGRPQAEMQLKQAAPKGETTIRRILYAPTWEGFVDYVNYCSINELGVQLLKQLAVRKDCEVVFKPHPYTGSRRAEQKSYLATMKSFCRSHGIRVEESLVSIHECMNNSDLLITDVSSVLNDYLMTRKPIILCINEWMTKLDLAGDFPSTRAAYHLQDGNEVGKVLDEINEGDALRDIREEVRKDSLGDFEESSMEKFRSVILGSVSDAVQ